MTPASTSSDARAIDPALDRTTTELRESFRSGVTRKESSRRQQLRALLRLLENNEGRVYEALRDDLGKPQFESYGSEIGTLKAEIRHALNNLRDWMRPRTVPTPLSIFPSRSRVEAEPKGMVLILAPWNYPLQLCLDPLVAAIAAGNVAVVKPSEWAPATTAILAELIPAYMSDDVVRVVTGDGDRAKQLMEFRFDHVFFTGSTRVGRLVAAKAAETLTPVTLELGGKSPVVVDTDFDMKLAARRITWGKFWNAGQSCVAPDYVLVPHRHKQRLTEAIRDTIAAFFGNDPSQSASYGRIVNDHHFDRLTGLIDQSTVVAGGGRDPSDRYIEPTLVDDPGCSGPTMTDEIFGPILPIIGYDSLEEATGWIARLPEPLALYVFSRRREVQRSLFEEVRCGGGCINDTLVHFASPWLPFGGRGASGYGNYHGRFGFDTFSHLKAIVDSPTFVDIPIRYPPFRGKLRWLKWFMS